MKLVLPHNIHICCVMNINLSAIYICYALDSLLDVKKQRLLLSLQSVTEESSSLTAEQGSRGGGEEGEGEEGGREEIEREEGEREGSDDSDDLQGIKCRAPVKEVCCDHPID